jgi:dipeptidyl aminopeptidase/acylaminoacyl peptidase
MPQAALYAGVPVTDLIARLGYATEEYRDLFSAPYHVGKAPAQDVAEYQRRSPVYHVHSINTPLLIHGTTNDRDVHVLEVEHLIQALKVADKCFEYKIYSDAPGGHSFNRIDTPFARASRAEIYAFLAKHLKVE